MNHVHVEVKKNIKNVVDVKSSKNAFLAFCYKRHFLLKKDHLLSNLTDIHWKKMLNS